MPQNATLGTPRSLAAPLRRKFLNLPPAVPIPYPMLGEPDTLSATRLSPDDIVRELRHLPSTPKVLPRLKQLLGDSNSSIYEIVGLIRLDPGMAARVLQVSNSAYFSKGTRCHTVEEAVGRVGFNQIYELVSYAVASQVLVRPLDVYGLQAEELWRLSVACALAAEELAVYGDIDRNMAYTIGLLHSVGMVAIDEWSLRLQMPFQLENVGYPADASESERAQFGFSQAEVGAALLRHWTFPTSITEPVRHQYAPNASAGFAKSASLLSAAKWIRSAVCDPRPAPPVPAALLDKLRLNSAAFERIRISVARRLESICALLEISPARPAKLDLPEWVRFPAAAHASIPGT